MCEWVCLNCSISCVSKLMRLLSWTGILSLHSVAAAAAVMAGPTSQPTRTGWPGTCGLECCYITLGWSQLAFQVEQWVLCFSPLLTSLSELISDLLVVVFYALLHVSCGRSDKISF